MPNNIIKSYADKTGKSIKELEDLWDRAKKIVTDEYNRTEKDEEEFYSLVTAIFKKMSGVVKEETVSTDNPPIDLPINIIRRKPDSYFNGDIPVFNVDNIDTIKIAEILNGKEPYKRWREYFELEKHKDIVDWANSNIKPFMVKTPNGTHIRIR